MKKLLYIHGFRSSAKSSTILNLKANYHEVEVHAFDVTHHPAESIKKIEDYVREHGIEILAGSSLGGYYTLCARVDIPKIAVMPKNKKDVLVLLSATEEMATDYADRPIITMSMAGTGLISRLCGEVFGSSCTFGAVGKASAPGQMNAADLDTVLNLIHNSL